MKKSSFIYFVFIMCITVLACYKDSKLNPNSPKSSSTNLVNARINFYDSIKSGFIPMDSANKMINSYLYSINYAANDSDIRSFTINADSLRSYISNTSIKNIKVCFAHTLAYINAGNGGQYAGYQSGGLTIIIAGYDNAGNYVYFNGSNVLDHAQPCPTSCQSSGSVASDYLK